MRTIKFRGKDNHGTWRYGCYVAFDGLQGAIYYPKRHSDNKDYIICTDWCYVDENTVGQYTGIKDAFDNDIYEGDIVRIDGFSEKGYLIVVFYEGSFALATTKEYGYLQQGAHPFLNDYARMTDIGILDYQGLYRVVGNIIDNPELLLL